MADNLQVSAKISEEKSVNILTLSVVRRDGAITPFKSDKISNAINEEKFIMPRMSPTGDKIIYFFKLLFWLCN